MCPCLDIHLNVNFGNSSYIKMTGKKYTPLVWDKAIVYKIQRLHLLTVLIVSLFAFTLISKSTLPPSQLSAILFI